jgi:hypothetical protein
MNNPTLGTRQYREETYLGDIENLLQILKSAFQVGFNGFYTSSHSFQYNSSLFLVDDIDARIICPYNSEKSMLVDEWLAHRKLQDENRQKAIIKEQKATSTISKNERKAAYYSLTAEQKKILFPEGLPK